MRARPTTLRRPEGPAPRSRAAEAAALGGDELGRTQQGNNNAYCQDNEITWFDWSQPGTGLHALAIALYLDGSDDPDQAPDGTWLARGPSSRSGARAQ